MVKALTPCPRRSAFISSADLAGVMMMGGGLRSAGATAAVVAGLFSVGRPSRGANLWDVGTGGAAGQGGRGRIRWRGETKVKPSSSAFFFCGVSGASVSPDLFPIRQLAWAPCEAEVPGVSMLAGTRTGYAADTPPVTEKSIKCGESGSSIWTRYEYRP